MTGPAWVATMAGAAAWAGALAGWRLGSPGVALVIVSAVAPLLWVWRKRSPAAVVVVAAVAIAGATSGMLAASRHDATLASAVPEGRVSVVGVVADQAAKLGSDMAVVIARPRLTDGPTLPPIVVLWPEGQFNVPQPGDTVMVSGRLVGRPTTVRGDPVAGRLEARDLRLVSMASGPFHRVAALMRGRVETVLDGDPRDASSALLAGFLIGDTSRLGRADVDALRQAGLSHFVAVSGSNVALFLAAWWLLLTPFAGARVRAVVGIVGVVLFTVVTRWEPSVLRAATMVGLVLSGRLAGIPIGPVVAMGWGVAALLLLSGDLATSVGFQLSVAATIGVMVGARWARGRRPRPVWSILGATGGAQIAVAPVALLHFGTLPLMAPLANLIAAPLVTMATALGGLAVILGNGFVVDLARLPAAAVLVVSDVAAGWPQLDRAAFGLVVVVGSFVAIPKLRPVAIGALGLGLMLAMVPPAQVGGASLTALDVGQGDAVILRDGAAVMLIDGGRDPAVLAAGLRRQRISRLDILVVTHGDADHAGGLVGLIDEMSVGEVWVPAFGDRGEFIGAIVDAAERGEIGVVEIAAGYGVTLGRLRVSAIGPTRRYKSDNDGAIVLWIEAGAVTALLPSDIEAVAQLELPPVRPDVMLVPHHGSATTDPAWLEASVGSVAVVSVGDNTYGHPNPGIIEVLHAAGANVMTTHGTGDVIVPLLPP